MNSDIDEVVLVGGMTRMPIVQSSAWASSSGVTRPRGCIPDEVVAIGAAIQGTALLDESRRPDPCSTSPRTLSA